MTPAGIVEGFLQKWAAGNQSAFFAGMARLNAAGWKRYPIAYFVLALLKNNVDNLTFKESSTGEWFVS